MNLLTDDIWNSDEIMSVNAEGGLSFDVLAKLSRAIEAAILKKLNSAEPVAWHSPTEGLSYENHYSDNVPLYKSPAPSAVEGWTLVPIEPTRNMIDAAHIDLDRKAQIDVMIKYVWKQMLSAARSE